MNTSSAIDNRLARRNHRGAAALLAISRNKAKCPVPGTAATALSSTRGLTIMATEATSASTGRRAILARHHIAISETYATLIAEERFVAPAEAVIRRLRRDLERYIAAHPDFIVALTPLEAAPGAPRVVRVMVDATRRVGVGPMAAVAGTIAALTVEALHEAGATHVVLDNGGDVAMWTDRPVTVGIFAGRSPICDLAFRVAPRGGPLGICTSSGTVGHSLSFGRADAAVVVAADAALADAAATALGNAVLGQATLESPERLDGLIFGSCAGGHPGPGTAPGCVCDGPPPVRAGGPGRTCKGLMVDGIEGMLAIAGEVMACWGELPELVRIPVPLARVARGREVRP
jgi:uncharacterized protein